MQTPNNVTSKAPYGRQDIWIEIRNKIRIDPNLGQEKSSQLWKLLEQFLNIFAWHKGELGCCKFMKHVGDTQGFPMQNNSKPTFILGINKSKEINRCVGCIKKNET